MGIKKTKFRSGAAAIYIVVFAILLFSVISIAFARLISSGSEQTQNEILSQAAYDASLAGIEDAKLAIIKYENCTENPNTEGCSTIISTFQNGKDDCDVVTKILRGDNTAEGEIEIVETNSTSGNTSTYDQAYTCVTLNTVLADYRAEITTTGDGKVIPLQVNDDENAVPLSEVKYVKISWYSQENRGEGEVQFTEYSDGNYKFHSADDTTPTPPVLTVSFVQTPASTLKIDAVGNDDTSSYTATNRGQIMLVPVNSTTLNTLPTNQRCAWNDTLDTCDLILGDSSNLKLSDGTIFNVFAYSNYHKDANYNYPYGIQCDENADEFICSTVIELPSAVDNSTGTATSRNEAYLVVTLPYNKPDTDIRVEMLDENFEIVNFGDTQIAIDSTGRASDVYSRNEARVELSDTSFPYPYYALAAYGDNTNGIAIDKNLLATKNCWYTKNGVAYTCTGAAYGGN